VSIQHRHGFSLVLSTRGSGKFPRCVLSGSEDLHVGAADIDHQHLHDATSPCLPGLRKGGALGSDATHQLVPGSDEQRGPFVLEAGLCARAVPYWQRAGQHAIERSAYLEAIAHLTKGLEVLATLPDTPERTRHDLDLQLALGPALMIIKGWAAPEVAQVYNQARALCQQVGDTPQPFPVLWGLWLFDIGRGEVQAARELGE
jgi:hypothetical protein